jgi:hypothetical protein
MVFRVTDAHLVEELGDLLLGAQVAGQQQQSEPGTGVRRHQVRHGAAGLARPVRPLLAAQGAEDGREREQRRGIRALRLGEPPLLGPRHGGARLAEHHEPVTASLPVVPRLREQGTRLRPASLGECLAYGNGFGIVESRIERGGVPVAEASEGRRRWRHPLDFLHGAKRNDTERSGTAKR